MDILPAVFLLLTGFNLKHSGMLPDKITAKRDDSEPLGEGEAFAGFKDVDFRSRFSSHVFCPGFGVLCNQIKSIEMHGDHNFWGEQLDRSQGICWPHGVVVANRDHCESNPLLTDQTHVAEKPGISSQVDLLAFIGGQQESGRVAAVAPIREG